MNRRIILASTSPRRIEILKKAGIQFEVVAPEYEEEMNLTMPPQELVKHLARRKATSIAHKYPDAIIIGADTFVVLDNIIFGKPKTPQRAKEMLLALNGKAHQVMTGLAVLDTKIKKEFSDVDISRVREKKISEQEIDTYIATGEPLDKAAAYAIQGRGAKFIERIEGDIYSIMGLPLDLLMKMFRENFPEVVDDKEICSKGEQLKD